MKACVVCGQPFDEEPAFCRQCWYGGRLLAGNLKGVLAVLESATGTAWAAEHTGGNCFWLVTYLGEEGERPYITVTAWPEVLTGDSTVREVENDGGWLVGVTGWHEDQDRLVPDPTAEVGLSSEELGRAVMKVHADLSS